MALMIWGDEFIADEQSVMNIYIYDKCDHN